MKIWAKTMLIDKITRDRVYEKVGRESKALLEYAMRDICELFDIPCPLVLKSHFDNFTKFNIAKFLPADFVESIDFDYLIIENITE